jgi:hypothetical protein
MKIVFLGERNAVVTGSVGLSAQAYSPPEMGETYFNTKAMFPEAYFELWDYVGGTSFRGFVAGQGEEKALFAFFDASVVGRDLKQG